MDKENIRELIILMRKINSKLRCFGLFKAKNRSNWKITQKHLQ